jgi:hypothetical protein
MSPAAKTRAQARQEFKAGRDALLRIVRRLSAGSSGRTIYIVVDRPESCEGDCINLLLNGLFDLVMDGDDAVKKARVMVWVVLREEFWTAANWLEGLDDQDRYEATGRLILCHKNQ